MKRNIFLVSLMLIQHLANCQALSRTFFEMLKGVTVSFGVDTTSQYIDINGVPTQKKIYYATGAGVFFYITYRQSVIPCIITAKHVVANKSENFLPLTINIRLNGLDSLAIDQYKGVTLNLYNNGKPVWIELPDSTVDLVCLPLDPNYRWPIPLGTVLPYSSFAKDNDYYEGRDIYALGYPSAAGQDLLTKAIFRKGIISWVAPEGGTDKYFLIDCNIFPGNSGGPVFSVPYDYEFNYKKLPELHPIFYGIVDQRRFNSNNIVSKMGKIKDVAGNDIYSVESTSIGVLPATLILTISG